MALRTGTELRPCPEWSVCSTPIATGAGTSMLAIACADRLRRVGTGSARRARTATPVLIAPATTAKSTIAAAPIANTIQSAARPGWGSASRARPVGQIGDMSQAMTTAGTAGDRRGGPGAEHTHEDEVPAGHARAR